MSTSATSKEELGVELNPEVETITVPARRMAEELGNRIVANMILIGALIRRTGLIELAVMKGLVGEEMLQAMREINVKALEAGFSSIH